MATKKLRESMRDEDTDVEPTEEQFQNMLQQAVLRHYPNPERKGCLDSRTITIIAHERLPHENSQWDHISHCSPCYRVFLDGRSQFLQDRSRSIRRRRVVVWIAVVAFSGILGLAALAIVKSR